jgi:hypothetical protein
MVRLPKLYLLLSSVLLFSACSISRYNRLKCEVTHTPIEPVVKPNAVLKYKASIDILKNHLTGLLIVKQTDSTTKHLVFVTELGMKMFDIQQKGKEMSMVYVFEPLNKPLLIESLLRNFSNMFFLNAEGKVFDECSTKQQRRVIKYIAGKESWFYSTTKFDDSAIPFYPTLQETYHGKKLASKIEYVINSQSIPYYSKINCKQYGLIKFYFELNYIQPAND